MPRFDSPRGLPGPTAHTNPLRPPHGRDPVTSRRARPSARRLVTFATVVLAAACGEPAEEVAEDEPTTRTAEARVPLDPTAPDELPPAIVGNGGELSGVPLRYIEGDSLTTGYLAVPDSEGPFPALVIIHEWNGLVDRVRQVADDFAAEGYVTLAVDLFDGRTGSSPDENRALVDEVSSDMQGVVANLDQAVQYLRSRADVTGRIGAMGWCFGGGIALSFGLDGESHEATAIFYGRLVDDPEVLAPMDHEVYGTFARLDSGPAPGDVEAFEEALRAAGVESDIHVYDDVNHGFWLHVDQDMDTRADAALDAWQRLKDYLDRTLGS